ncbi:MAG: Crp/Fnr family transcriptional regulator [Pseudomonadota bacterium]
MLADRPFLDRLDDTDRDALLGRLTQRSHPRGGMVISVSEQGRDVFFIVEGRAQAILHSRDGKAVGYRDMGPGDMFGELAAIDGQPRSASIIALDQTKVGRLSFADFQDLVNSHPSIAWVLMTHMSTQIRRMTGRIFEYSTLLVRERLIRELIRLAGEDGTDNTSSQISPAPTHFFLASRISTHREAVSREMSSLAKQGLLEKRAGVLHLRNLETLRALCPEED